jgi:membrane protein implicated in regulation of membrane protease activity
VLLCGVIAEIGEVVWGRRLARRMRPKTGAEAMIGRRAEVVEPCRPNGHVRVGGELWEATCSAGCDPGDSVRITAVRELTLEVVPDPGVPRQRSSQRGDVETAPGGFP